MAVNTHRRTKSASPSKVRFSIPTAATDDVDNDFSKIEENNNDSYMNTSNKSMKNLKNNNNNINIDGYFYDANDKILLNVPKNIYNFHQSRHKRTKSLQSVIVSTINSYSTDHITNSSNHNSNPITPTKPLKVSNNNNNLYLSSASPLNKFGTPIPLTISLPPFISPSNKNKQQPNLVYDGKGYSQFTNSLSSDISSVYSSSSSSSSLQNDSLVNIIQDMPEENHDISINYGNLKDTDEFLGIDSQANVNLKKQLINLRNSKEHFADSNPFKFVSSYVDNNTQGENNNTQFENNNNTQYSNYNNAQFDNNNNSNAQISNNNNNNTQFNSSQNNNKIQRNIALKKPSVTFNITSPITNSSPNDERQNSLSPNRQLNDPNSIEINIPDEDDLIMKTPSKSSRLKEFLSDSLYNDKGDDEDYSVANNSNGELNLNFRFPFNNSSPIPHLESDIPKYDLDEHISSEHPISPPKVTITDLENNKLHFNTENYSLENLNDNTNISNAQFIDNEEQDEQDPDFVKYDDAVNKRRENLLYLQKIDQESPISQRRKTHFHRRSDSVYKIDINDLEYDDPTELDTNNNNPEEEENNIVQQNPNVNNDYYISHNFNFQKSNANVDIPQEDFTSNLEIITSTPPKNNVPDTDIVSLQKSPPSRSPLRSSPKALTFKSLPHDEQTINRQFIISSEVPQDSDEDDYSTPLDDLHITLDSQITANAIPETHITINSIPPNQLPIDSEIEQDDEIRSFSFEENLPSIEMNDEEKNNTSFDSANEESLQIISASEFYATSKQPKKLSSINAMNHETHSYRSLQPEPTAIIKKSYQLQREISLSSSISNSQFSNPSYKTDLTNSTDFINPNTNYSPNINYIEPQLDTLREKPLPVDNNNKKTTKKFKHTRNKSLAYGSLGLDRDFEVKPLNIRRNRAKSIGNLGNKNKRGSNRTSLQTDDLFELIDKTVNEAQNVMHELNRNNYYFSRTTSSSGSEYSRTSFDEQNLRTMNRQEILHNLNSALKTYSYK